MADDPSRPEIEALSGGLVHCMLKIAHSTEHAEREDFQLVPLGIPAGHCTAWQGIRSAQSFETLGTRFRIFRRRPQDQNDPRERKLAPVT